MPLVTIAGGMGTGVGRIARVVAAETNLDLYDDRKLHLEAVKMGIRSEDLKEVEEKTPGFFDSLRFNSDLYLDLLESVVYSVCSAGQGIVIGHGSQVLLREFGCALHVFIHAAETYRIRQVMDEHGMSREGAERMIRKSDSERRGFLRFAFHMEWNDPALYDLQLNTEKLGVEGAAELIVHAVRLKVVEECGMKALDTIERLMQVKRVQAALHEANLGFYGRFLHIEVPERGVVEVTGFTNSEQDKRKVVELVRGVQGVERVKDEVVLLPEGGI